jgi:hypothetical protein
MAVNQAKQKLNGFISELQSSGHTVIKSSKKGQIYSINGRRWNIRSRSKSEKIKGERVFWYDISSNILNEVEGVIYLTTESYCFAMIPSEKLETLKDRMYKRDLSKGIFTLNWDASGILLPDRMEPFYAYNLKDKDCPNF